MSYQCRICLDEQQSVENLISPCQCRGTMKYVHRNCLNEWRSDDPHTNRFHFCNECKYQYVIENCGESKDDVKKRKRYKRAVTLDCILLVTFVIVVLVTFSILVFMIDRPGFIRRWLRLGPFGYLLAGFVVACCVLSLTSTNSRRYGHDPRDFLSSGFAAGVITGYRHITKRVAYHHQRLALRSLAQTEQVKDFNGREAELNSH